MDRRAGIIRLLTPPFDSPEPDPGYIRGYPPGVRENGGQYTHGALWLLLALIRMGDEARAHGMLQMLLPYNHSDSLEKARIEATNSPLVQRFIPSAVTMVYCAD